MNHRIAIPLVMVVIILPVLTAIKKAIVPARIRGRDKDRSPADFSNMAGEPEDLSISNILHKAFIKVNEEGTEAAAATAVVVATRSAAPDEPVVFRADRPFLFFIRENQTGAILFMGRFTNRA